MKSFCISVFLPLVALVAIILLLGCEQPVVAPMAPPPHQSQPVRPIVKIVAYTAQWCSVCRNNESQLTTLKNKGVKIESINIDEHPELGITSIPVYVVVRESGMVTTQDIKVVVALVEETIGR